MSAAAPAPDAPPEAQAVDGLQRIGVIGAGQMGCGIAHVCALAGLEVVLTDVSEDAVEGGY